MSRKNIIVVNHNPGDPLPDTNTDWAAVNAMTDEDIQRGIAADPDANPITDEDIASGQVRPVVNVKRLRETLGLTQEEFAERYRIPVGTLRDWEQRRKRPDAPARAYLEVISRDPERVAELLVA
jgi:putative transcriptional regulator